MARYTVTIVSPDAGLQSGLKLRLPFESSAIVSAFIDELFSRIQRQGIALAPNTHIATLHVDSETGAVVDAEDVLADVLDPSDQLFAVFQKKPTIELPSRSAVHGRHNISDHQSAQKVDTRQLQIRVITPELAKHTGDGIPLITMPATSTFKQLHDKVAEHLQSPQYSSTMAMENECNCALARKLIGTASSRTSPSKQLTIVSGKSEVRKVNLPSLLTKGAIIQAVQTSLGPSISDSKKVLFHEDQEREPVTQAQYSPDFNVFRNGSISNTIPVVTICSKQRHTPVMAKAVVETSGTRKHILDLHTSELPISIACADFTLSELGLPDFATTNGIIDIFAISRACLESGTIVHGTGKSTIFRNHVHWEPRVKQSDRGVAMFLSSLQVFISAVEDIGTDDRFRDAVYHIFDLLTRFPPALRSLHILMEGKTPTAVEAAALSHAIFTVLDDFMPTEIVGTDKSRLFEGARLLFGFILDKARSVKLGEELMDSVPYITSMGVVDVRDIQTREPVFNAVRTDLGLIEKSLFEAMAADDTLLGPALPNRVDDDLSIMRAALMSGGITPEIIVFSIKSLTSDYKYFDNGDAAMVYNPGELKELQHLAELCGRNKLGVHRPSQLTSAIAPCLAFDREAHLAVYTGQLPCADPGQSSEIFRPRHGNETIDESVIEQLIAPILVGYEANGTAVFDLSGGSTIRRMQEPEEIIMFAVDTSSSMGRATDFADVNDDITMLDQEITAHDIVDPDYYNRTTVDDLKDMLSDRESFDDMIAIIGEALQNRQRLVARRVLEYLRLMMSREIVEKHSDLESRRQRLGHYRQYQLNDFATELEQAKRFWAALKTHEDDICDFLIFRANTSPDVSQRWMWSPGEQVPSSSSLAHLPSLSASITDVPDDFTCPISHGLMEDAVTAPDGFIYSRSAIQEWFRIRKTSPMTRAPINSTRLRQHDAITTRVANWVAGEDLLSPGTNASVNGSQSIKLQFISRSGGFDRRVPKTMSVQDLYKLVFRGLKARYTVFQLSVNDETLRPSTATISSKNIKDGQEVTIRIADDNDMTVAATGTTGTTQTGEMCLIKVYSRSTMLFSYWTKRDTPKTLGSIIWKYWRSQFKHNNMPTIAEKAVWLNMFSTGDDMTRGNCQMASEKLADYLNSSWCSGSLEDEPLYPSGSNTGAVSGSRDSTLVLKVDVQAPSQKKDQEQYRMTRLDVLKQMFEASINRMLAYSYKTHIGLCTFASEARITTSITHVLENFRRATANMEARGDTALWDAIALCKDQIGQYKDKFPQAKPRIIVISDGLDTNSKGNTPAELAWRLSQDGIALDSICLGTDDNEDLRAISYFLGCYRFHPTSLPNALLMCELEPFLSLTERPTVQPPATAPRNRTQFLSTFRTAKYLASPTMVSLDKYPDRKEHANAKDFVVQLSAASMRPTRAAASDSSRSGLRITRLMNEMRTIVANGVHPKYDIYVSEVDMSYWKVVMSGPEESPYSEGTFLLYIHAGESYPTFAPDARFITKIKHPNVNAHGRICHALLGRDWTSDTSMSMVLTTIYGLLYQAETSDPVNVAATLGYHHDQVEYAEEVREYVQKHAGKTRAQWKQEFLSE